MRRTLIGMAVMGVVGATGCTGAARTAKMGQVDFAVVGPSAGALRAGHARILDVQVNPLAPLTVEPRGAAIAVTFGRRASVVTALLDPATLGEIAREPSAASASDPAAPAAPQRMALPAGRSIRSWMEGDEEHGYQAVVQPLEADGGAGGMAVVISPLEADVMGVPRLATLDSRRVVAVFPVMMGGSCKLVAVALDGT